MFEKYDIIVVGAGHAGCEAAHAAAKMGAKVLLVTMNMNTIAQMSCNPAMGGVAKGQIVREIDALGGMSGIITDKSAIQFRMLNKSKGPAMWSPRTQNDRMRFAELWRLALEANLNIDFWQEMITELIVENGQVRGVKTGMGLEIFAKSVILTNGTFLNGLIHIGEKQFGGGRTGERSAKGITEQLVRLGFEAGRMKTGTPPRVDGRTIDYSKTEEQKGDETPEKFSFSEETHPLSEQRSCFITYTNSKVHDALKGGFDRSPMFNGRIRGIGPRYCPSIEDKIDRFADKDRHQIFIEPEGWNTVEIYVNGFSTSLPEEVQYNAIRLIPGFEKVKMFRPGYAVEYDFFPPTQLDASLETKLVENLYFAGQINGTTGYEEAACQGLMAGINAFQKINEKDPLVLKRSEAYIGVLIDDLINKGTDEPYRMFTSRSEHRILLRQDNADIRLTEIGHAIGLADDRRKENVLKKSKSIEKLTEALRKTKVSPEEVNSALEKAGTAVIKEKATPATLLKRPQLSLPVLAESSNEIRKIIASFSKEVTEQVEIRIKYEDYIEKEQKAAAAMIASENLRISDRFDYDRITALSSEAKEKLNLVRPKTIGQASRISGVSPADVSVLTVFIKK